MYNLFISHAWSYSESYRTVCRWLDESGIAYRNYSVPQHNPIDSDVSLKAQLREQVRCASIVIIISGMYAAHSKWIDYEIDVAKEYGKYIIGLRPWGQERVPLKIQNCADEMVGWNSAPLIQAIKNH